MDYAFYHRTDQDGKCCAAIYNKFLKPGTKIIGWNYGDNYDPSVIPNDANVYISDIHFPFDEMIALRDRCKSFVWCDHHISAFKEADQLSFNPAGYRDVGEAACSLLWKYLSKDQPVPYGVKLISLYDIWNHNEFTIPLNLALDAYDLRYDSPIWDCVLNSPLNGPNDELSNLIQNGKVIDRYKERQDSEYARLMCFPANFNGLRVLAANRGMTNSKLFDSQWNEDEYDAMMTFATKDGMNWNCSLYTTREDVDVSEICQQHGGGGHRMAAGFIWNSSEPPVSIDD